MRIAVLTNAYPPDAPGGAARIAEMQVRMLEAAGMEVRVFRPEVPWLKATAWKRLWGHLKDLRRRPEVVADVLAWKPDVLVSHNLTGVGFGTPKAVQKQGVKWIHLLHDVQLFEPSGRLLRAHPITFWQWLWGDLRWFALGKPNLVISPTEWLLKQHQRRGFFCRTQTASIILPNPGPKAERFERSLHRPLRLLVIGLTREKGIRFLGAVLRRVTLPFELHVVGEGPEKDWLTARVPHVVFHGYQSAHAVLALMKDVDLLLVPSRILENQPTVILEAASVGLPVIATPRGGIPETLGDAGYHPQHVGEWERGAKDWARTLEKAASDEKRFAETTQKMWKLAEGHHDPDAYAAQFVALLKSIL